MAKVTSILALAVGMFASACFGDAAYNNLISDGDMEAAGTNAYGCKNATLSKDSGVKYSGAQSLRISNTVPYFGSHLFPKSIAVPTNVLFSGYVRAPSSATLNTNLTLVNMGQWKAQAWSLANYYNAWLQGSDGYVYVACSIWAHIYKTLDGIAWTEVASHTNFGGTESGGINALIQTSNGDFFCPFSPTSSVWKSTNMCEGAWTRVAETGPDIDHGAITILEASNGYIYVGTQAAAGEGDIWKSTDHGTNWTQSADGATNLNNSDRVMSLLELNNGDILVGSGWNNGGLYRSTNNGASWSLIKSVGDLSCNGVGSLIQASNGDIYLGGIYGSAVWKSTDNGTNWTKVADGNIFGITASQQGVSLLELANGDIWASVAVYYSLNAIYRTSDGGASWVKVAEQRSEEVGGNILFQASNGDIFTGGPNWPQKPFKTIGISVAQAGLQADGNWCEIETVVRGGDLLTLATGSTNQNDYLNYDELMLLSSLVDNGGMERDLVIVHTGTAQDGTTNTITLAADASAVDDYYNGMTVQATNDVPPGWLNTSRTITDYDGASRMATVSSTWAATSPSNTSGYEIWYSDYQNGIAPRWWKTGSVACTNSDDEHTGIYAQQVGAGDASVNYVGQTVTVEQGKYYTFGGWLKRVSGAGNVNISISGATIKNLSSTNSIYSKVSHTFAARSTSLDIRLYADSGTVGLLDDVSLVRAPPMGGTVLSVR